MKKKNKQKSNLNLKKSTITILSQSQMDKLGAGDDDTIKKVPGSFECIPPFNAPPYFNTTKP